MICVFCVCFSSKKDVLEPVAVKIVFWVMVPKLSPEDIDRVIGMAWEDRTPFEAIEVQFGLKENDVRQIMRRELKRGSFERWRERVKGRATKHRARRGFDTGRFRCSEQRNN